MYLKLSIVFCFLLTVFACQQDDSDVTEVIGEETETTLNFHDNHLVGMVTDAQGRALSVNVEVEGRKEVSNAQGIFSYSYAKVNKNGSWLSIKSAGFWPYWAHLATEEGMVSSLRVSLDALTGAHTFMAQSGLLLNWEDLELNVPSKAFIDKNGKSYEGEVHFYIRKIQEPYGRPAAIQVIGRSGILINETIIEFLATNNAGEDLFLSKGIQVTSSGMENDIMQMHVARGEWKSLPRTDGKMILNSLHPIVLGQWTEGVRQSLVIKTEEGLPMAQVKCYLMTQTEKRYPLLLDQQGKTQVAVGKDEKIFLEIEDQCGGLVHRSPDLAVTGSVSDIEVNIPSQDLRKIHSEVKVCEGELQTDDRVFLVAQGSDGNHVLWHEKNEMSWMVPRCGILTEASYFRGSEKLYNISISGAADAQEHVQLVSPSRCVNKVSAVLIVDGVSLLLDMDDYVIFNEVDGTEKNLVISDLAGFTIVVPNNGKLGNFVPSAMLFNHPSITDCKEGSCMGVMAKVKILGAPGEAVSIAIEGMIDGKEIKGTFNSLLTK